MKRWTIAELKLLTDRDFIMAILHERRATITNVYSPLSQRLIATWKRLEANKEILPDIGYGFGDSTLPKKMGV